MAEANGTATDTREQRFSNKGELNELHRQLSKQREQEIKQAIAAGLVDDPSVRRTLDNAIAIVGTCQEFCPQFEKVERHLRNEVKRPEMIPGTEEPDYSRMVKAFARPNDSNNIKLPSEIRPPPVLQRTVDYLFHDVLPTASSWISVQEFIFDRTRAIRQDFTIQGRRSKIAVECHERIARFLILSLHESKYGPQQEDQEWEAELRAAHSFTLDIEQLNKTLTTLMQYYDDFRLEGVEFHNEAEFRAYRLLLQLRDADVARRTQRVSFHVLSSPYIQSALNLRNLAQHPSSVKTSHTGLRATPYAFTRVLKEMRGDRVTFLMACLMETHFGGLRKEMLRAMAVSYISKTVPIEKVTRMLGFETDMHTEEFLKECGLSVEEAPGLGFGAPKMVLAVINRNERNNISDATPRESKAQSALLVAKRGSHSWPDLLDGKTPPPDLTALIRTGLPPLTTTKRPATTQAIGSGATAVPVGVPSKSIPPQSLAFAGSGQPGSSVAPGSAFGSSSLQGMKSAFGPTANTGAFGASGFSFGPGTTQQVSSKPSSFANPSFITPIPSLRPLTFEASRPTTLTTQLPFGQPGQSGSTNNPFATSSSTAGAASSVWPNNSKSALQTSSPAKATFFATAKPSEAKAQPPSTHPQSPATLSISTPRKSSAPAPLRKLSLPAVPPSPAAPSPKTVSRLVDERNEAAAAAIVEIMARACAQLTIADALAEEWSRRRRIRPFIQLWRRKAMETRAKKKVEERRLKEVEEERIARRAKLMGVLDAVRPTPYDPHRASPGKGNGKAREVATGGVVLRPEPLTVEEMQQAVEMAASERDVMWEKGAFLEAVQNKVRRTAKSANAGGRVPGDWVIWLTRCEDEEATWSWLRIKFGGDDPRRWEGRRPKDVVVLPLAGIVKQEGPSFPGLLILELPPRLSTLDNRTSEPVWDAALRLLGATLAVLPRNRSYRPSLILLYWGSPTVTMEIQQHAVLDRATSFLRNVSPGIVSDVRVVVFEGASGHLEAFKDVLNSLVIDVSGSLVDRTPLETVVSAFTTAWDKTLSEGLAFCNSVSSDRPSATWRVLAQLFSLLIDGMNEVQRRVSDLAEVISEELLPPFAGATLTNEELFSDYLIKYLGASSLAENATLTGLRAELTHLKARKQPIPFEPVVEQLAWQLACTLTGLTNEVFGSGWKSSVEQFEEAMQNRLRALRRSFPARAPHQEQTALLPTSTPQAATKAKKRSRTSSGEQTHATKVIDKRPRSSLMEDMIRPIERPRHEDVYSEELANELVDLERLLAQSESLLAA